MTPQDPDLLPQRELFRRPRYWALMALPLLAVAFLHLALHRLGIPAVPLVPLVATIACYFYGYHMTRWLRRRWGRQRRPPRNPDR
ncbi:MAG TPA: hypothetical protein VEB66_16255 [Opitutaceae bacterium]|nr:hypothetical protein [Opitutaceae bacterium]